ncbi:Phosphorylated carbohydrates phosphatase TM_1254 [[Eubacterium] infirmum]|nr:Phosphorylated carbohydrates phosphatase TM_1254 [[Eubacterium] infirmum]
MKIKAAIFDADGTLLDSMGQWNLVPYKYVKSLGVAADENIAEKLFTMTISEAAEFIIDEYELSVTVEEAVEGMDAIIREFYKNDVKLKDGAGELLEFFKSRGIPMVIGTSTDRDCIEVGLERTGISAYFDRIYTSTEVGKSKEKPDLFIQAMEFMESSPDETIVFEDGLYSLRTAAALGMKTVGIFDEVSLSNQKELKELADLYVDEGESLATLIEGLEC